MTDSGYTKFPNLLLDWLLVRSADFTKRELVLLLVVVRNTIGWNRTKAQLSCRFVANATGMKPGHVSETIAELEKKGIIIVDRSKLTTVISMAPRAFFEAVPELGTVPESVIAGVPEMVTEVFPNQEQNCSQIGNGSVPESGTNKEREIQIKETTKTEQFPELW